MAKPSTKETDDEHRSDNNWNRAKLRKTRARTGNNAGVDVVGYKQYRYGRSAEVLPANFPPRGMSWAIEVDHAHAQRLVDIIRSMGHECHAVQRFNELTKQLRNCRFPVLVYTKENIMLHPDLPSECFLFITRVFYVPYTCSDCARISMHYQKRVRELRGELHGEQACVKLTTSPKDFEAQLEESLVYTICEDDGPGSDCEKYFLNQSRHNILLMCVYSDTEGLFRWGVVTKKFAETHLMTSTAIAAHWQAINAGGNLSHGVGVDGAMGEMDVKEAKLSGHSQVQTCIPVCRAFFKLSEIVSNMLPRWGWNWPDKKTCISIDVGASPGGWTQSLSNISYGVVAIDPGLLRDDIVALPNVIHIKDRVENESVQTILQSLTSSNCAKDVDYIFGLGDPNSSSTKVVNSRELLPKISAVVCDMNMDARDAVRLLRQHVLCFIPGFLRRTPYCDQCSESAEQLARNQAQGLHNEMAGESVPNIRIDGVPSQSWCDMHGDNGLKHDEERIPRTSRENGLELAGDLEEVEHAIVVVTLKLCKNPKQHHIDRAVACVMKELDVPMCANCGGRGKSGEGLLDERCVKVVHLCANSSCERTVIVRRKLVSQ